MKIAIHEHRGGFSDKWIQYCINEKLDFCVVDCWDTDIIAKLEPGDLLLWHWSQNDIRALSFARHIIAALLEKGVRVFPDIKTCWHYNDKVAQKYLLEAMGAPLVPSYVFYDKGEAQEWIKKASFPKVFKLRRGAGSSNVKLVKSPREALKLVGIAFGDGFSSFPSYFSDMKTKVRKIKNHKAFISKLKRLPSAVMNNIINRTLFTKERGYIYMQDFLPNNLFDTRITVIGGRAFGFIRHVRQNDFRASGSGIIDYDPNRIDHRCVKIALNVTMKLRTQSLAFDFLFDQNNNPLIGEISYCYVASLINNCLGYWDEQNNWHKGNFWPQELIIKDMLNS